MSAVEVRSLHKTYQGGSARATAAVDDVSLQIDEGEFVVLLGPSGSGKTTLLRCIAGLERPDAGEIVLFGETVYSGSSGTFVSPERRDIGMVFQSFAIWPHMTVMENVCLALTHGRPKLSPNNARKRAREALEQVGMDKLADNSATLVSGGQQQRIALARALAVDPQMLLMDEPLSNLDAQLREEIRQEIRELGRRLHTTIIYVTHDRVEAMALADRVVILDKGRIVQSGGPKETYRRPSTPRIAEFLGSMNWLGGQVTDDPRRSVVQTTMGFLQVLPHTREPADQVLIGMRPEHIHLTDEPHPKQVNSFQTTVTDVTFLGEYSLYLLNCNGRILQVKSLQSIGDRECLWISIPPEAIMIFDRDHERASAQND